MGAARLTLAKGLGSMALAMPEAMSKTGQHQQNQALSSGNTALLPRLVALVCLAFFFGFPRLLIRQLGMDSPWVSYFYLYGNGLIVFLVGILIILRSGACRLGRGRDTFWFLVLLAGYVFFAALHAVWTLAALHIPFRGGA